MAPSWMSQEDKIEDGRVDAMDCVGPYNLYFVVFHILCYRGILVIYLLLGTINKTLER
jgi:hypothetical protein